MRVGEVKGSFYLETSNIQSKFKIVKYGEIIEKITNGLDERNYIENGFNYLRVSSVKPNFIDLNDVKKIQTKSKKGLVSKGQVLLTRKGSFGHAAIYNLDEESYISSEIFKIQLDNSINPSYFTYLNNLPIIQKQLKSISVGAMMGSIDQKSLMKIQIPLPPLEIQAKLVLMMDKAYNLKKEKEQKAKELLNSIDDFVMTELGIEKVEKVEKKVFGIKLSALGRFDVEYNLPFYTKFEKELKMHTGVKLKTVLSKPLFSGKRPVGGVGNIKQGVPSLGGEHVNSDGSIKSDKLKFISQEFAQKYNNIFAKKDSLLLVKDGATTGKIGKIPSDYPFDLIAINEHVFCIEPDLKKVNLDYLFCVVRTNFIQEMLQREITGGTVTGLTADVVENLIIPLPPLQIQQKIADEVEKRRNEAFGLQKEAREFLEIAKSEFEREILK